MTETGAPLATLIHVSPVFEKMFQGKYAEAETLEVELTDFSKKEVGASVRLAAIGPCHHTTSTEAALVKECATPAMLLVDKNRAFGLKHICREHLKVDPCFDYLVKYEEVYGVSCSWSPNELKCLISNTLIIQLQKWPLGNST